MLLSTDATYPAFRGSLSKASWTALPRASSLIPSNNFITSWGWVGCSCGWGFAQLRADRLEWGAPKLQDATMVTLFFTTCTRAIALSLSLSCLYILSVILVGRILYYYHRFLLKYTLFWYHGGLRINSSSSPLPEHVDVKAVEQHRASHSIPIGLLSCWNLWRRLMFHDEYRRSMNLSRLGYYRKLWFKFLCLSLKKNLLTSQEEKDFTEDNYFHIDLIY